MICHPVMPRPGFLQLVSIIDDDTLSRIVKGGVVTDHVPVRCEAPDYDEMPIRLTYRRTFELPLTKGDAENNRKTLLELLRDLTETVVPVYPGSEPIAARHGYIEGPIAVYVVRGIVAFPCDL